MNESLWARLRRLLRKRPPAARMSRTGPRVQSTLRHLESSGSQSHRTSVRWQKERFGPALRRPAWISRISKRQRVLVALAAVSVVAMLVTAVSAALTNRRLPRPVHGVWRSDDSAYAGRLFELRSRRIAFVTRDSTRPILSYPIERVDESTGPDGMSYIITFTHEGESNEFSFVYRAGPPERIHFAHQPRLRWRRDPNIQSVLP